MGVARLFKGLTPSQSLWVLYFWLFFFTLGVVENFRSALLPLIKGDLSLSDQALAGLFMVGGLASVLFLFFGGRLIDRFGQRALYHVATALCVAGLASTALMSSYAHLLGFFFLLHAGFTLYSLLTNALIPTLGAGAARLLTLSHGCYGLGAALSPFAAEYALKLFSGGDVSVSTSAWRASYQLLLLPFGALWLLLAYLSAPQRALPSLSHQGEERVSTRALLSRGDVWLFALLFGAAISAEVTTSSWLVRYLTDALSLERKEAGYYLAGFYTLFTAGRFVMSGKSAAAHEAPTLTLTLGGAALCLALGVALPTLSPYLFALSGLAFALVFPSMVMTLNAYFQEHRAHILGLVVSGGLTLFMALNALVGFISERASIRVAYSVMCASALTALLCARLIRARLVCQLNPQA